MIVETGKLKHQLWPQVLPIISGQFVNGFPFQPYPLGQSKAPSELSQESKLDGAATWVN